MLKFFKKSQPQQKLSERELRIKRYLENGRIPFSKGYTDYKFDFIHQTLDDANLMQSFASNSPLPKEFGFSLDERVVEYPWVFSRLNLTASNSMVLDAGGTLNRPSMFQSKWFQNHQLIIYTLGDESVYKHPNLSYMFHDLRSMLLRDNCMDCIVCISTLEHVGTEYDFKKWSISNPYPDFQEKDYRLAMQEMHRVLKPGGRLLVTVPFGRKENHGWLQQFDQDGLNDIIASCPSQLHDKAFYRYSKEGWQVCEAHQCAHLGYHNLHMDKTRTDDGAAAARSIACLEFVKS